jgi:hypothetical protein
MCDIPAGPSAGGCMMKRIFSIKVYAILASALWLILSYLFLKLPKRTTGEIWGYIKKEGVFISKGYDVDLTFDKEGKLIIAEYSHIEPEVSILGLKGKDLPGKLITKLGNPVRKESVRTTFKPPLKWGVLSPLQWTSWVFPRSGGYVVVNLAETEKNKNGALVSIEFIGGHQLLLDGLSIGLKKNEVEKLLGSPAFKQVTWEKPGLLFLVWLPLLPIPFWWALIGKYLSEGKKLSSQLRFISIFVIACLLFIINFSSFLIGGLHPPTESLLEKLTPLIRFPFNNSIVPFIFCLVGISVAVLAAFIEHKSSLNNPRYLLLGLALFSIALAIPICIIFNNFAYYKIITPPPGIFEKFKVMPYFALFYLLTAVGMWFSLQNRRDVKT